MALNGRLEELRPSEIFQLISLTRKSGKLIMTCGSRQGIVVFRKGRVVFAASNSLHAALDDALSQGHVGAGTAFIAGSECPAEGKDRDSGSFVVEVNDTNSEALEKVIRSQIEATVHELVEWNTGAFVFEPVDLPAHEDISLESGWLEPGVDPDALVLNALTNLDEFERSQWQDDLDRANAERVAELRNGRRQSEISAAFEVLVDENTGRITWAPSGGTSASPKPVRDLERLRRIMNEMAGIKGMSPSLTAEVALLILRYAAQILGRGVLFVVRQASIRGIGQFGLVFGSGSADRRVRNLDIPIDAPSVFANVLQTGRTYRGRLEANDWNRYLVEQLGGREPTEVAVVPLIVESSVVCALYGDNLPEGSVISTVDGIEILMHEIGLAVEKARLERRLKALEERNSPE